MSFDWSHYLRLAQELSRQSKRSPIKEAKLRSAISRAYYAVFIMARNHLRNKDNRSIPRLDAHQYVITEFSNRADPIYQKIGYDIARLRKLRNWADYQDSFEDLTSQTVIALRLAQQIINTLDRL